MGDIDVSGGAGGGGGTDDQTAAEVPFTPAGTVAATDVQAAIEEVAAETAAAGAPTDANYLVGTANGGLSAEIVVGTSPGGELGGTWGSPTVDATHSGSAHVALGTTPSTQAFSDSAAGGSDATASKNDHKHAWPALGTSAAAVGTSAGGSATTPSKSDHVHATGAGTPSTQAMGDSAATGTGPAASMTDHKHAMPAAAVTSSGLTMATAKLLGRSTASTGAIEEITLGTNLSYTGTTLNAAGGSGAVATDAIFDASGDLVQGTGADTSARLARGTALTTRLVNTGTSLAWIPFVVRRTSDGTAVNNSTTLVADDTLLWSIGASEVWHFQAFLICSAGGTSSDYKFGWTVPASCTMTWGGLSGGGTASLAGFGMPLAATSPAALLSAASTLSIGGGALTSGAGLAGVVVNSTNAGSVNLTFAQDTAVSHDNKILTNSLLLLTRLA